ncbi:MAG TPA: hypothetical protein VGB97_04050 [Candidatus Paceibacterota bacterium]|jgi:hypothetical protein
MNTLKKTFAGVACTILVASFAYAPYAPVTPKAHALPVAIVGDAPRLLEQVLDAAAWMAAKTIIQSMTQSIVTWINSGFQGSPAFVTDLNRNLGNLADTIADDFIYGLDKVAVDNTGLSIRAPFQDQLRNALRDEFYRTTSSYGFDARHPYRDCYGGGDFSLDGWMCESQNPANNPYGRYQLARRELFAEVDKQLETRMTELGWGNGFLSWRGPCGPNADPAKTIAAANKSAASATTAGGKSVANNKVSLQQKEPNAKCSIRTPGAMIEETLGITVNSPLRQLEVADSINEIVGALMTQMVGKVLGGNGLSGVSEPTSGGGRSFLSSATDFSASLSSGFTEGIRDVRSQVTKYRADWQRIADAANAARQRCTGGDREAADAIYGRATERLAEANRTLAELDRIETDKNAMVTSGANDPVAVNALVSRFQALMRGLSALAQGEVEAADTGDARPGSFYSEMRRLAASCET